MITDDATRVPRPANRPGCSQFFAIIQTIVSGIAISDGFGKSLSLLTASQIVGAEKVGRRTATGNAKADRAWFRRSMLRSCFTLSPLP